MKDLNNIVVEALDFDHGTKVVKTFNKLGVLIDKNNPIYTLEDGDNGRWYGVIDGIAGRYAFNELKNAKIITLKQLKAMKEDKSEYPKLMYVGSIEPHLALKVKKEVFFKDEYGYWCRDIDDKEKSFCFKYAQDIEEEKPDIALEFKGQLFTGDFGDNTMTFKIDGNMILKAGKYLITEIKQDQ